MRKYQNTRKYHTQESQEVSTFPAGDHKAARNREDSILSHDVASGMDITQRNKIDKTLVAYRLVRIVMTSIITLRKTS